MSYNVYQKQKKHYTFDGVTWYPTHQEKPGMLLVGGLNSCDDYPTPQPPINNTLIFEFTGNPLTYKLNFITYSAKTSPYTLEYDNYYGAIHISFDYINSLTKVISMLDTSKVTDMSHMFYNCDGLTSLNTNGWDTSNVVDMGNMFHFCSGLTSLDLSSFNTSNVIKMNDMFYGCNSLTSLDLTSFDTSKVISMYEMFRACTSLTSLDLSNWDMSKYPNIYAMFEYCTSLQTITMKNCNQTTIDKITQALTDAGIASKVTIITQ